MTAHVQALASADDAQGPCEVRGQAFAISSHVSARRPLASLAEPLCTQNLTDGRFSKISCGLSKDFESIPRFLPLGMIAPDRLAKTTIQRRKTAAPMMTYAAMIAPNALHRIALKHSFKMNIACSRNWAFPRRIGALERRQRSNSEAKAGRVHRRFPPACCVKGLSRTKSSWLTAPGRENIMGKCHHRSRTCSPSLRVWTPASRRASASRLKPLRSLSRQCGFTPARMPGSLPNTRSRDETRRTRMSRRSWRARASS